MAFQLNDGQGTLHRNDKAGVETRPDYTGSLNVGGTMYRLSAWIKEGKSGKWMSINAQISETYTAAAGDQGKRVSTKAPTGASKVDDDIPF
jgi:hypothetical protein